MQYVLRCDSLLSDAALSEGNILRDGLVEVVAYLGESGEEDGERMMRMGEDDEDGVG